MNADLEQYILDHIAPEPELLAKLSRYTHLHHLYSRQCSGHLQGRLLAMLSGMISPKRILELGTFTGYSALCLAEGLQANGELHTVEHNDEDEEALTELFECDKRIHLHIGDASEMIEELPGPWDLVFIDANKREYAKYLRLVLPKMAKGGYIFADNTLWDGKVANDDVTDPQTLGIKEFNDLVRELNPVIIPIRDGMTIIKVN